jgi:hypothetical protein
MQESDIQNKEELQRPLGMTLVSGLYLFFFLLTVSSFGQPIPLFGFIYQGTPADALVFVDSLICLYLFLGLMKRQRLTWYLLLGYNVFETANTLINLLNISPAELAKIVGETFDYSGLLASNVTVMVAILLLSLFIFRQKSFFSNHSNYLF